MENNLQLFENEQFGAVRVVMRNGEPWFVAKDVCGLLGLEQVTRAMSRLDDDEVGYEKVTHPQGPDKHLEVNVVNESGLYHLILCSNKPEAKAFKRWITHEVLPSIRKTGAYAAPGTITNAMSEVYTAMQQMRTLLRDMQQVVPRRSGMERALQARAEGRMDLKTLSTPGNGARRFLDHDKIKRKISIYMIEEDLSTEELAALLGVDKRSVFRYRSGEYAPCGKALAKLCELLGCTVNDLLI